MTQVAVKVRFSLVTTKLVTRDAAFKFKAAKMTETAFEVQAAFVTHGLGQET